MSRLGPGRRTAAILAIVLLIAVAGSDLLIAVFWLSHPMLTAIVSALVVVVLSVAVIEVVLSRRAERRWRVLAQTALMELAEAANTTWSTLAEVLELPGASEMPPDRVRAAKPHGTINWFALLDREMLSVDKRSNLWVVGPNIGSYMCYKISPLDPVDFTKTSVEYVLSRTPAMVPPSATRVLDVGGMPRDGFVAHGHDLTMQAT